MSDSGFSGLPPGPRTGDASFPPSLAELKAKIIEIRGEIRAQRVREKMEGEIVRHNPDGTTRIKTDKGEVTVELRGRERPPEGARVEVEIPPGNPPKQITVRPAPEQARVETPQQAAPAAEPPTQTRDIPKQVRLDPRTSEDLARQVIEQSNIAATPRIPLEPETIVRLTPLPKDQAQDIIRPALETIEARITSVPPVIEFLTETIGIQIDSEQTAQLLSVASPEQPAPQPVQNIPLFATPQTAPVLISAPQKQTDTQTLPRTTLLQPTLLPLASAFVQDSDAAPITTQAVPPLPQTTIFQDQPFAQTFPKQKPFDIRIQSITPPQLVLSDPQSPDTPRIKTQPVHHIVQGKAGSITGEVTGMTAQNLPVLSFFTATAETPQHFIMQFHASNLPVGTQVNAMPQAGAPSSLQSAPIAPFIPFEFFSGFQWPAMDDLVQTLQQAAPQAVTALANSVPGPAATPRQIPAMALFFIAAVRSGDLGSWLGDKTIDTLRRLGKGDILSRVTRDLSGMQRTSTEQTGQDWRALALPMMDGHDLQKMMLYYRHDKDKDGDEHDKKNSTRFIFDLDLSRMGAVQLDGLHRPGKLDLIVRTYEPFSASMQQHMRRTYTEALGQTELTGELSFQNKPEQFVKIDMPNEKITLSG